MGAEKPSLLRRLFPIGEYRYTHWLDTDRRGAWLVPVCMGVCFLAIYGPIFILVMR
jgi:hypothetical protein